MQIGQPSLPQQEAMPSTSQCFRTQTRGAWQLVEESKSTTSSSSAQDFQKAALQSVLRKQWRLSSRPALTRLF